MQIYLRWTGTTLYLSASVNNTQSKYFYSCTNKSHLPLYFNNTHKHTRRTLKASVCQEYSHISLKEKSTYMYEFIFSVLSKLLLTSLNELQLNK